MINVAILNTETGGGAARAALRLHEGLTRTEKIESDFFNLRVEDHPGRIHKARQKPRGMIDGLTAIARRISRERSWNLFPDPLAGPNNRELFSNCKSKVGRRLRFTEIDHDIINLHWITYFIDFPSFIKRYAGKIPLVWTLHDMNLMTGGCHYDGGCGRFRDGCGCCPQLIRSGLKDASSRIFQVRKTALKSVANDQMHIVAPSRWLSSQASGSKLLSRFSHSVIPYGIDTGVFFPAPKTSCVDVLGISQEAKVVLFVSSSLSNHRKGIDLLLDALPKVLAKHPETQVISVGADKFSSSIPVTNFGQVNSDLFLRTIYSAADLLVIPSREDNLPNVVLEAMACGTPAVGFRIGGVQDMIRPGRTGWLADSVDSLSLAKAIQLAIDDLEEKSETYRNQCRKIAVAEYPLALKPTGTGSCFHDCSNVKQFSVFRGCLIEFSTLRCVSGKLGSHNAVCLFTMAQATSLQLFFVRTKILLGMANRVSTRDGSEPLEGPRGASAFRYRR